MKKQYLIGSGVIFLVLLIASLVAAGNDKRVLPELARLGGGAAVYFAALYVVVLVTPLRKKISAVSVLAFSLALSVLVGFVNEKGRPNQLDALLSKIVSDINSTAPKALGNGLQLDSADSANNTLRYNYTFTNSPASSISSDQVQQSVLEGLRTEVCTKMQLILEQGARIEYVFDGNDGIEITKLNYDKKSCFRQ